MDRAVEGATARFLARFPALAVALVVAVLGVVLGVVMPTLLTTGAEAPSAGAAVLALALAALLALGQRRASLAASLHRVPAIAGDGPPLLLPGRVTDPVHHPVRPRAPGLA